MRTICLFLLIAVQPANACINIKGVTLDGEYQIASGEAYVETLRYRMTAKPASLLFDGARGPHEHPQMMLDWTKAEDDAEAEAVRHILTGEYEAAIEKLEAMEAANPGDYSTAANLGTAYELAGNNEAALKWITEGIARKENAHYGTEWLHRAILETKVAMEKDPGYLQTRHILPVQALEEQAPEYTVSYDGNTYDSHSLVKALYYQLGERMLFVKPEDPVVADLLYTLALVEANVRVLEPAVELLQLAKEYGYHDTAAIDAQRARYQATIDSTWKIDADTVISAILALVLLSLPLMLLFIILREIYRLIVPKQVQPGD